MQLEDPLGYSPYGVLLRHLLYESGICSNKIKKWSFPCCFCFRLLCHFVEYLTFMRYFCSAFARDFWIKHCNNIQPARKSLWMRFFFLSFFFLALKKIWASLELPVERKTLVSNYAHSLVKSCHYVSVTFGRYTVPKHVNCIRKFPWNDCILMNTSERMTVATLLNKQVNLSALLLVRRHSRIRRTSDSHKSCVKHTSPHMLPLRKLLKDLLGAVIVPSSQCIAWLALGTGYLDANVPLGSESATQQQCEVRWAACEPGWCAHPQLPPSYN